MKLRKIIAIILAVAMFLCLQVFSCAENDDLYSWGNMSYTLPNGYSLYSVDGKMINALDDKNNLVMITRNTLSELYSDAIISRYSTEELLDKFYEDAVYTIFSYCDLLESGEIGTAKYIVFSGMLDYPEEKLPCTGIVIIDGDYQMEVMAVNTTLTESKSVANEFLDNLTVSVSRKSSEKVQSDSDIKMNDSRYESTNTLSDEAFYIKNNNALDVDSFIFPLDRTFVLGESKADLLKKCILKEYEEDIYMVISPVSDFQEHKQVILITFDSTDKVSEILSIMADGDLPSVVTYLNLFLVQSSDNSNGFPVWAGNDAFLCAADNDGMITVYYKFIE